MRERPGNQHEKAFKEDFLGDRRQTSKTRQRPLRLSGGALDTADGAGPTERARSVVWHRARRLLPQRIGRALRAIDLRVGVIKDTRRVLLVEPNVQVVMV